MRFLLEDPNMLWTEKPFNIQLRDININFRIQPIHEAYVYLGIGIVSSLQWKTQTHITTTKLIKECKLLVICPTIMKQKIQMANTILQASIAYSFYTIPYSLLAIKKLDTKVITLHKTICDLPICQMLSHNCHTTCLAQKHSHQKMCTLYALVNNSLTPLMIKVDLERYTTY